MSLPGGLQSRLWERPEPVCLPCIYRRRHKNTISCWMADAHPPGSTQVWGVTPLQLLPTLECWEKIFFIQCCVQCLTLGVAMGSWSFLTFIFTPPLCFISISFPTTCQREPAMPPQQLGRGDSSPLLPAWHRMCQQREQNCP